MLENLKGINPAMAIASIITQFNTFIQADISKENCLITLFILPWEKAYGVSAGAGEIHFTVRSDSNGKMRTIETTLEHIAHEVADEYRLKCDIKWTQGFQANENDEMAVHLIKTAVKKTNLN
jgi:metal-dependent amidase/aminoacylase/carboxypeptidase family protein